MGILNELLKGTGEKLKERRAGADKLAGRVLLQRGAPKLDVSSPAFEAGGPLPKSATSDGDGVPPDIEWSEPPPGTRSFVLICEDPDAPLPDPFVHWMVYGIPESARRLDASLLPQVRQGKNSKLKTGYTPAAPPPGHGRHHYQFQVFALDTEIDLAEGVGRGALFDAMRGHILAWGSVAGLYER